MPEEAPVGVDDPRFAGDDAPPAANGASFSAHPTSVFGDREKLALVSIVA